MSYHAIDYENKYNTTDTCASTSVSHVVIYEPRLIRLSSLPRVPSSLDPVSEDLPGVRPDNILKYPSPIPNINLLSFPGAVLTPSSTGSHNVMGLVLTPLSKVTPSSTAFSTIPAIPLRALREAITHPPGTDSIDKTPKSNKIPKCLKDNFDLCPVRSTRATNNVEVYEIRTPLKVSLMSPTQRAAAVEATQTTIDKTLRKTLKISSHDLYHLKHRSHIKGRQSLITPEGLARLHLIVKEAETSRQALNENELKELFLNEAQKSYNDNKGPGDDPFDREKAVLSLRNWFKLARIHLREGQITTDARWLAARDIRNMVSMCAMIQLFKDNPPHLLANMDATQFNFQFATSRMATTGESRKRDQPLEKSGSAPLGVCVKQFTLITASGHMATVLILAESTMGLEDFVHFGVDGFQVSGIYPTFPCEVCFCKTRNGNAAFYTYIFKVFLVNFVKEIRKLLPKTVQNDANSKFFLIIDGEVIQSEVLQNREILNLLLDNNIVVGKGPASTSGSCGNPLDMGRLFLTLKKHARGVAASDGNDVGLEERFMDK